MSRFTRFKTLEQVYAAGYQPIALHVHESLRGYGVPMYRRGMMPIEGTSAEYFAPTWAVSLVNDWPLRANSGDDFDHFLLKIVIRRTVRSGDTEFAKAVCAVAMLDGARGVRAMLGTDDLIEHG
jgi:hypothetical protein